MPLFVVRHSHEGDHCPAQDPYMGAMLLNHLSRPNVRRHGVEILGEAVVQGEHTMFLIAEASDPSMAASSSWTILMTIWPGDPERRRASSAS